MANGRCRFHGGRVPKGDQWHTLQYPTGQPARAERKLARKLAEQEVDQQRRQLRRACMTLEERVAHDQWQKTHKPGKAARRAQVRFQRDHAVDIQRLMAQPDPPKSPEMIRLEEDIALAKALLATHCMTHVLEDEPLKD